jgi:hypothetical protein
LDHFFALIVSPARTQIIPHVAHARARVLLTKPETVSSRPTEAR